VLLLAKAEQDALQQRVTQVRKFLSISNPSTAFQMSACSYMCHDAHGGDVALQLETANMKLEYRVKHLCRSLEDSDAKLAEATGIAVNGV
jgi:hypothetical protein